MMLLFVLAAIFTGIFLFVWGGQNPAKPSEPFDKPKPRDIIFETEVVPWKPPVDQLNELIHEDSQLQRVKNYPRALNLLAIALRNHLSTHILHDPALKAVGGFERLDPEKVDEISLPENAPKWRGRPVEVVGTVITSEIVADSDAELGLDPEVFRIPLQRGVLDVAGREVLFLMIAEEGRILQPGERIKIRGAFYRVKEVPRDWAAGETDPAEYAVLPMILGKEMLPAVPLDLRDHLPEGFADSLKNLPVERIKTPPQEDGDFFILLGYILGRGEAALEGAEPLQLRGHEPLERPDDYVLDPVRVWGQIVYLAWESFDIEGMREEDAPIQGFWHAIVADPMPKLHVPISVIIPMTDLPPGIVKGAWVNVKGLYFRVHAFPNQKGVDVRMPMMIATSPPELSVVKEDTSVNRFLWYFVAAGLVLVGGLVIMLVRDRRRARRLDTAIREKRTTRRKREGMDLNVLMPPSGEAGDEGREEP